MVGGAGAARGTRISSATGGTGGAGACVVALGASSFGGQICGCEGPSSLSVIEDAVLVTSLQGQLGLPLPHPLLMQAIPYNRQNPYELEYIHTMSTMHVPKSSLSLNLFLKT